MVVVVDATLSDPTPTLTLHISVSQDDGCGLRLLLNRVFGLLHQLQCQDLAVVEHNPSLISLFSPDERSQAIGMPPATNDSPTTDKFRQDASSKG
jgi:hypothetical protein